MQDLIAESKDAVDKWEPRIQTTEVDIVDDEDWMENNQLGIKVPYVMRNSNRKGNFVFPFAVRGERVI